MTLSGSPVWKYDYDANNNIVKTSKHAESEGIRLDGNNRVVAAGDDRYEYDADGFLYARNDEQFEFNSLGQLVRAFETGKYDVHYFYDGIGRLVARRDVKGAWCYLNQKFRR